MGNSTTRTVMQDQRGTTPIVIKLSRVKPQRLVFIEEYDQQTTNLGSGDVTYNQGSFLHWKLAGTALDSWWGDPPALFHGKGTSMSFADGHAAFKIWNDRRTLLATRITLPPGPNAVQPGNKDLIELKQSLYGPP